LKVIINEPKTTQRELEVSLPQASLKDATDQKIDTYRKKVQIKGFRTGKVPRKMVVARYGDAIRQEALDETINSLLNEEYKKNDIKPVAPGVLSELNDDKESDISFKVLVEVDPVINIEDYTELGINAEAVSVDADEVEKELSNAQRQFGEETDIDVSAEGSVVVGQYLNLNIDGEAKEVPSNPEFRVEIGTSQTPEFDEGLKGLKVGDEKEIAFTFPTDYETADLAGKEANYKVLVSGVKNVELPEINEEFAAKLGEESVASLKKLVEENILSRKEGNSRQEAHQKVIEAILAKNDFEVPEARIRSFAESVLKKEDVNAEEIENVRAEATFEIKKHRILEDIAKKEKVKAKQTEVDARIQSIGAQYGIDWKELKSQLRTSGRIVNIREEVKFEKTLNFLIGIKEGEAES
jgi:trigger factor